MDPMKRLSAFLHGFAPTSALVCSIDGDPPGEGGGQAPQQPPPAPATPAGPPQFTPEQQAWIQQETDRKANAAAAAARRAEQERQGRRGEQPPPANRTEQPTPPAPQAVDVRTEINRIRSFERAAGGYGLTPAALEILESDFQTANPPDPAAWVKQRAEAFGWKAGGTPNGNGGQPPNGGLPTSPPPAGAPTVPVTSRAAPPGPATPTEDTPILSMSVADREALRASLRAKHGDVQGDVEFANRHLKELAARNVRIRPRLV